MVCFDVELLLHIQMYYFLSKRLFSLTTVRPRIFRNSHQNESLKHQSQAQLIEIFNCSSQRSEAEISYKGLVDK